MESWMWLMGAAAALFVGTKWYGDRKQRQATSEFFNKVLDKQIEQQDKDILEQARTTDAAVEAYERAREEAKRHNNLLRGYDIDNKPKG